MHLRECPYCLEQFWRQGKTFPVTYLLEHKQGCYLGPTTILTLDSPKFEAWNNRTGNVKQDEAKRHD